MSKKVKKGTYVGLWGHSISEGRISYQFHVKGYDPDDGYYLQLFEWFFGDPSDIIFRDEEFLSKCNLYVSREKWLEAAKVDGRKDDLLETFS